MIAKIPQIFKSKKTNALTSGFQSDCMSKEEKIKNFNPNGVGLNNGHFIGLPFEEKEAEIILLPVTWDVTASSGKGTALGPQKMLAVSTQIDLYDPYVKDAWKLGVYMLPVEEEWIRKNEDLRRKSDDYISFIENGGNIEKNKTQKKVLEEINNKCEALKSTVYNTCNHYFSQNKLVGLVGGEHSVPLGYLEALAVKYSDFGILQIDAHMDLRKAYEGFNYSHASIFYNVSKIESVTKIVQVGIRDFCEEEFEFVKNSNGLIKSFFDHEIAEQLYKGVFYRQICTQIIQYLPQNVYISFDIDGLEPSLCPNTGTPVPGGLDFNQALYLIKLIVESGKTIIGFDLCEVNGENDWDANVGARLLYRISNLMGKSNGKI